jgi:ABC-type glycerol-3-phosphate transport system substrate-binding protein
LALTRIVSFWLGFLTAGTLALSTLAACGSGATEAAPTPTGPVPTVTAPFELPITIALAGRFEDPELALLEEQIAAFEAQNPAIMVEVISAPRETALRHERFAAQLSEGDASIDIYLVNTTWLARLASNGWLIPLEDYARDQNVRLGDFLLNTTQASTFENRLMALPWTADGGLLFYRQDLLDRHGHRPPASWADLQQVALDVKTEEALPAGFVWQGAPDESLTCNTLEFIWALGGDVLAEGGSAAFDSPENRAALHQMVDMIAQGASPPEVATYREPATLAAFQAGDAVFMRNWFYAWDRLNSDDSSLARLVGVASLPASCLGGRSLALSTFSHHPEQAFRFMAFLTRHEQQLQLALQGVQPPALETAYGDAELLAAKPIFETLHPLLAAARARPPSASYPDLSSAVYTEVHRMLIGDQTVDRTAANIQDRLSAFLR